MEIGNNNNQKYQNQFQNNNYQNVQSKKRNTPNLDQGYSSSGTTKNKPNYNYQNQQKNFQNPLNAPIMVNNIRNTEAPNMNYKNQQFQENNNQKEISRMTEFNKGKERPAWSYREIKYDEFKQPRNTEIVTTKNIPKKSNIAEPEISRKSNIQLLQEKDKKYFNNVKYQKVKVTKKVKGGVNIIQRKGPEDDFEQKNSIQNYNNNNLLDNINNYSNNQYDDKNNFNLYNEEDNNGANLNDELNNNFQNNVEQNDDGLNEFLEDKIRDNNNLNKNENNENDEQFDYILNNNNNNANNMEEINNKFKNDEFQNNENYQLDLDTLEEANSDKNQQLEEENEEEYIPVMKNNDIDNNYENNNNEIKESYNFENDNQEKARPTFIKTTTKKVKDKIDPIKTIPEANLEKWNLVADYTP